MIRKTLKWVIYCIDWKEIAVSQSQTVDGVHVVAY